MTIRHWNGRYYHELRKYRWVGQVPIKAEAKALRVNWCEITIVRENTGKQMYHNAWITSHELSRETVPELTAAGRAHWKVENENLNVLKNQGYNFEHNYQFATCAFFPTRHRSILSLVTPRTHHPSMLRIAE
jgi:hypothetical protein